MNPIKKILPENCIYLKHKCPTKKNLFEKISDIYAENNDKLSKHQLFKRFFAREQLGTTNIDYGIAIPHIRMPEIESSIATFIQLDTPICYNESANVYCDLILSLIVPEDKEQDYLNLLAYFIKCFHLAEIRQQLRQSDKPEIIIKIFSQYAHELQTAA